MWSGGGGGGSGGNYGTHSSVATTASGAAVFPISNNAAVPTANAIWIGDIEPWMDENYLYSLFAHTGDLSSVKLIRDKTTGVPSGYGFLYFASQQSAQRALDSYNGQAIPGTNKRFRLNFAAYGLNKPSNPARHTTIHVQAAAAAAAAYPPHQTPYPSSYPSRGYQGYNYPPGGTSSPTRTSSTTPTGGQGGRTSANTTAASTTTPSQGSDHVIFVGDLSSDVTEYLLMTTFQYYYPSVYAARVMTDPYTGASRGYGFVHFGDDTEKNRALTEMQGYYISYRPIKVNVASHKKQPLLPSQGGSGGGGGVGGPAPPLPMGSSPYPAPVDSTNTTIIATGLETDLELDTLKTYFIHWGSITSIKYPPGATTAAIQYATHDSAARCLQETNSMILIGSNTCRLSWSKEEGESYSENSQPQITASTLEFATAEAEREEERTKGSPKPREDSETTPVKRAIVDDEKEVNQDEDVHWKRRKTHVDEEEEEEVEEGEQEKEEVKKEEGKKEELPKKEKEEVKKVEKETEERSRRRRGSDSDEEEDD